MLLKLTHLNTVSPILHSEAYQYNPKLPLLGISFFEWAGATQISPKHLGFSEQKYFREQMKKTDSQGPS